MLQRKRPARRGTMLLGALIMCGLVSFVHRQSVRVNASDPVIGTVQDMALVPGQLLTVHVGRWWHDTITACFEGPFLARRNRAMTAQVHSLLAQNKDLLSAQAENARLRRLLRFQAKSPVPLLAAEVVAIDPNPQAETIVLAKGRADGVLPQTIALAPNGALGRAGIGRFFPFKQHFIDYGQWQQCRGAGGAAGAANAGRGQCAAGRRGIRAGWRRRACGWEGASKDRTCQKRGGWHLPGRPGPGIWI